MEVSKKEIFGYFLRKIKGYLAVSLFAVFGTVLGVVFGSIVLVIILKYIFDVLTLGVVNEEMYFNIMKLLGLYLVSNLISQIGWRIAEFSNNYQQPSIMRDIENDAFEKLQNHSYTFFANSFSGALVTKVNRLTRAFERFQDTVFWDLWPLSLKVIVTICVVYYFSYFLGTMMFFWAFSYIFIMYFLYKYKYKFDVINAEADSKVTAELADSITNVINTKIFAKKSYERKRFFDVSFDRFLKRKKSWDVGSFINIFQALLMMIGEIFLLYFSIKLWFMQEITTGTIVLIQVYVVNIMGTMWNFGKIIRNLYESLADAEEMISIISMQEGLKDPKEPQRCVIDNGKVEFAKVNFDYEGKKVFDSFDFVIKAHESIGLVGESGAGKSTIIKMLLRFSDISSGSIKIDNQDIRNITQDDLRSKISYVPQDSLLFHRSIKDNISYSKPEASFEEIISAAKKANIHDFIESLDEGYDTLVGERGVKLSGGERQRVSIARALLKDAPIVILDEATSSLDSKSETLIQKAIENLMKNKTTIIIAHRLSTIKRVDRIVVLDKGKIIEQGTHSELVRKRGKYHELWEHQSSNI